MRIIPAYAGSTPEPLSRPRRMPDHPRIRGEHPVCALHQVFLSGSSPHTRGAPAPSGPLRGSLRIIPAYAGSTSMVRKPASRATDHPRIRGEHLAGLGRIIGGVGSSPHTRGAPAPSGPPRGSSRIIPAYAGSTSSSTSHPRRQSDHPRIRGEHIIGSIGMVIGWGSSPHTRGALLLTGLRRILERIIPAYAGST